MARILIFGGHGKVALLATPLLVERGDEVTSVIRKANQAQAVERVGGIPLVADVERLDTAEIAALIAGQDAVVWSAGAGGGDPARTRSVDRDAAIRSMDAAQQAGVSRYVMVSYFNSSREYGVDPAHPFYAYAEAKSAADEYLRASGLDWTVLGPSTLTLDPASGRIDATALVSERVSRGNVALAIAATLVDGSTVHRTIRFNDGQFPIGEAIRG